MAVYTDVAAEDLAKFLAGYELGELLSYKGIAEGRRELELPGPHRARPLHPYALRETRGSRRRSVLPGADGAPRGARHHLPAAGKEPQRRDARPSVRPAGGDRHLPRRHVDQAAGSAGTVTRSARRWRACISPAPTLHGSGETACRSKAGARFMSRPRRAPTACSRNRQDHRRRARASGATLAA